MSKVTLKQLFEAGVHFGHRTRYWDPKMAPYIFDKRDQIHIIDLDKTLPLMHDAVNFASRIASHKGKILFVGTKFSACKIIKEEAVRAGMPYVDHRWLGGMLTNYKTVRQSIKRLKELEELKEQGQFHKMIKKEALSLERELAKLERSIGGIKNMGGLPEALFVIDVGYENIAVTEARRLKIPVIGIVDTNHKPDGIDYIVPGNDDSMKAIRLYASTITNAILEGRASVTVDVAPKEEKKPVVKIKKAEVPEAKKAKTPDTKVDTKKVKEPDTKVETKKVKAPETKVETKKVKTPETKDETKKVKAPETKDETNKAKAPEVKASEAKKEKATPAEKDEAPASH